MNFQSLIIKEAKRQGLSGYALARASGVTMRSVQQYLAGTNDMNGERVARVAAVLGLELRPKTGTRNRARGQHG